MVLNNNSKLCCFEEVLVMRSVNKLLRKDEVWVIKLILFQVGVLLICGLIYIGQLISWHYHADLVYYY